MTGPIIVPPGLVSKDLDFGFARGSLYVFSAYWDGISKTVVLVRELANLCELKSRTGIRSPECFPASCFQMPIQTLEKTPKSSCEFTLFSISLFHTFFEIPS